MFVLDSTFRILHLAFAGGTNLVKIVQTMVIVAATLGKRRMRPVLSVAEDPTFFVEIEHLFYSKKRTKKEN